MSKYIDAEKLKESLKRRYTDITVPVITSEGGLESYYRRREIRDIIKLIDSLQQEQESVAERFARIVRGNLIGIDKEVQQKFEQLYFEVTGNKMYGGYND